MAFYEAHPEYGLIFTDYRDINECGDVIAGSGRKGLPDLTLQGLFRHCYVTNPSVMVKKEAFDRLGLFDDTLYYSEDWDMWLRIAAEYPLGYLAEPLVQYRIHGSNMSTGSVRHFDYQAQVVKKAGLANSILQPLLPKRLGSIYLVKARKQLKQLDKIGARASFRQALAVYPQRAPVYWLGIMLTYLSDGVLNRFSKKHR